MSFIFEAFGGGPQETKQTSESRQIPEFSPEALSLMGREIGLLTDLLIPLQRTATQRDVLRMFGGGTSPAQAGGQVAAGLLPGGASIDPFSSAVSVADLASRAGVPFQVAEQTRSLLPPQYAQLFAPNVRTESITETEQPGVDPFSQALQIGLIAAPFL